jgi:peptide/nickel transport system permease protein
MKEIFKNKMAAAGLTFIALILLCAVFAPVIAPYEPTAIDEKSVLKSPSKDHIFGTDTLGRDIFSRMVYGSRISLAIGCIAVGIAVLIGIFFGSIAGYYGGRIDAVIMRFVDIMLCFPTIFLILAVQSVLTPSIFNVMIVIGATSWMGIARLVRGEFLTLKEREFVEAARAIGCGNFRDRKSVV